VACPKSQQRAEDHTGHGASGVFTPQWLPDQVKIGGIAAPATFAGLVSPGEFQFNVVVPASLADGEQPVTAAFNGSTTQPGTLIAIQH
jgi:uncharacterized protein (TIGR03437 family)